MTGPMQLIRSRSTGKPHALTQKMLREMKNVQKAAYGLKIHRGFIARW